MAKRKVKEFRAPDNEQRAAGGQAVPEGRMARIVHSLWDMVRGKGITRRWLRTYFALVLLLLVIIGICIFGLVRNYYYNSIEQGLLQRSQVTIRYFSSTLASGVNSGNSEEFYNAAQAFVESFDGRDKMELQILNASGDVLVSSTGFSVENNTTLSDYYRAMQSDSHAGVWTGMNNNGEPVMAVSRLISQTGANGGAVRFVVSLASANQLITYITVVTVFMTIVVLLIMLLSGSYFIKSIVMPVQEITKTATKIAKGDFDIRLKAEHDDEIGALVESINSMARELAGSEKIKNDFISTVSHELRTPLTAIKGWGETVLDSGPEDREVIAKGMGVIMRETDRLSGLVEDLLDFSRLQSGRMTMNCQRLDLNAEAAEAVEVFAERCVAEQKSLTFTPAPGQARLWGDRDRLRQVFVNIIDNAIKYSDPGDSIAVTVSSDSDWLRVRVSDTGCGIPEKDLSKVARRFYKANVSRRGFGIGLAVAEEIATMHQGALSIESVEGEGTTVTVKLPVLARFNREKAAQYCAGNSADENKATE